MMSNITDSGDLVHEQVYFPNDALCKLFVGNVNKSTTDEDFKAYFDKYGQIRDIILMKDNLNQSQNRGFGFVTPELVEITDKILMETSHHLDNRELDIKRALPKDIDDPLLHVKTPRIFLGGLPHNITQEEISFFFNEKYSDIGTVKEVVIKKERMTGRPRGFCFVSFDNPHVVDKIMIESRFPIINNKRCEVKKADARVPIVGVPPAQLKYTPRGPGPVSHQKHPEYDRGPPGMAAGGMNSSGNMEQSGGYQYGGYSNANPNMGGYQQSSAYYNYYQNPSGISSQYTSMPNQNSYSPPYGYSDQRNSRANYPRNNNYYSQNNSRARPY